MREAFVCECAVSDGNAADFGDHSNDQGNTQVAGSNTRAIFRIEYISSAGDTIEFCAIHTKGNTTDFGNVSVARYSGTAVLSNQKAKDEFDFDFGDEEHYLRLNASIIERELKWKKN